MHDRGVSTPVHYLLALLVVTLLISGLSVATKDLVEDERQEVIRSELAVLGERIATDMVTADQLSSTVGDHGSVRLSTTLPNNVAGSTYRISITDIGSDRYRITLSSLDPEVSETIVVAVRSDVTTGTIPGGDVMFVADGSSLEATRA